MRKRSVSKNRYNVKHEMSPGIRYKPAKSESYSPIRWFLRSEGRASDSARLNPPIFFFFLTALSRVSCDEDDDPVTGQAAAAGSLAA